MTDLGNKLGHLKHITGNDHKKGVFDDEGTKFKHEIKDKLSKSKK